MPIMKKLTFAPLFLMVFFILIYQINLIFKSYDFIFSFSLETLIQLTILAGLILFSSLSFILFGSLAYDWKLILPVGLLASIFPLILVNTIVGLVLTVGTLTSFFLSYLMEEASLKSYLSFKPAAVLGPPTRFLSTLLVLTFSFTFFLAINKTIQADGFQIPDSLIDTAINLTSSSQSSPQTQTKALPKLTSQQIELLKQNPDLLKQYGLDPKILDSLDQSNQPKAPPKLANDTIKQAVKDQLQSLIEPYLAFVPAILAVLFFITLQSIVSILTILIYPLFWLTFYILEKSGFIKFTTEMRPVKKLVI